MKKTYFFVARVSMGLISKINAELTVHVVFHDEVHTAVVHSYYTASAN